MSAGGREAAIRTNHIFSRLHAALGRPGVARRVAWLLWGLPFLFIVVYVCLFPRKHSVALLYHAAVGYWTERSSLYTGPGGMNYLPPFVVFFRLFSALPSPLGDVAWRTLATGALATGLCRLVRLRFREDHLRQFVWVSLLSLPLSLAGLRNGQATVLLTAFFLHAIVCMAEKRWWAAAVFCTLAFVMKPLGIVLILLAPVVYWPLLWRLPITVGVALAAPFLFAEPAYVMAQYQGCLANLRECAAPTQRHFAEINGLLRIVGLSIPFEFIGRVCAAAGLPTLLGWLLLAKKTDGILRAVWLYTLAAIYLMLFNPMNEANSYVTLAPALAFWTVEFLQHSAGTRKCGVGLAIIMAALVFLDDAMRPILGNEFAKSWYPLMTVLFLAITVVCCRRHASDYFVASTAVS